MNKRQKAAAEASRKLPPMTADQRKHAIKTCLLDMGLQVRNTLYCLECGHTWPNKEPLMPGTTYREFVGDTCPNCRRKLEIKRGTLAKHYNSAYYGIITTVENYQVVRMFWIAKNYQRGEVAELVDVEVMRYMIDQTGRFEVLSVPVRGLSSYCDAWLLDKPMKITAKYEQSPRYYLTPFAIWPQKKVLPVVRRNGFKGGFHGVAPHIFFEVILYQPKAETLLKAKQFALFAAYCNREKFKIERHWTQVKMCLKRNYKVKDASIWLDHIDMLKRLKMDALNPANVCPANFAKAHKKLIEIRRKADEKERIRNARAAEIEREKNMQLRIERMDADNAEYIESKKQFFNLKIEAEGIVIEPLRTVEEFRNEGEMQHHCIFANEYYKKPESLILKARSGAEILEHVEVNLRSFEIVQCRGKYNSTTAAHDAIVEAVRGNIKKIKRLSYEHV